MRKSETSRIVQGATPKGLLHRCTFSAAVQLHRFCTCTRNEKGERGKPKIPARGWAFRSQEIMLGEVFSSFWRRLDATRQIIIKRQFNKATPFPLLKVVPALCRRKPGTERGQNLIFRDRYRKVGQLQQRLLRNLIKSSILRLRGPWLRLRRGVLRRWQLCHDLLQIALGKISIPVTPFTRIGKMAKGES